MRLKGEEKERLTIDYCYYRRNRQRGMDKDTASLPQTPETPRKGENERM